MGSSVSPSPIYFSSKIQILSHHKFKFSSNPISIRTKSPRPVTISASIAQKDLQFSWFSSDQNAPDEFNGWAVVEAPVSEKKKKKGATLVIIGAAASVALVGVIAYISLSKKGFPLRFSSQINAIQRVLVPSKTEEDGIGRESVDHDAFTENAEISEESHRVVSDAVDENLEKESQHYKTVRGQLERIIVPVAVDSTQQEALSVLKELKIIEDDVKADELCTRREYARWLVRANSQLERSRKHRIVPSAALPGSTVAAFNDVSIEDPDFEHIQSLAELGIIPSKLSGENSGSDMYNSEGGEGVNFFPERFISRQDLISWKAKLEYGVTPGIDEEFRYQGGTLVFLM